MQVTVNSIIRQLLPKGSTGVPAPQNAPDSNYKSPPFWPPDLFAICSYLLQQSDSYTYLQNYSAGALGDEINKSRDILEYVGKQWAADNRLHPDVRNYILTEWKLVLNAHSSINMVGESTAWVIAATKLLIIADIASDGIGFRRWDDKGTNWVPAIYDLLNKGLVTVIDVEDALQSRKKTQNIIALLRGKIKPSSRKTAIETAGILVPPAIACTLPKSRTPMTGCTLRSLTHNLSLHPGSGQLRSNWILPHITKDNDEKTFNIVFIPYPFRLDDKIFSFYKQPKRTMGYSRLIRTGSPTHTEIKTYFRL